MIWYSRQFVNFIKLMLQIKIRRKSQRFKKWSPYRTYYTVFRGWKDNVRPLKSYDKNLRIIFRQS
jgi:hypothetical protein